MEPIIKSILDNDQYKFSSQNYILQLFPEENTEYRFKNRGSQRFNKEFLEELQKQINYLSDLKLTEDEYKWMKKTIPYFPISYIEYLKNFRFHPSYVRINLTENNDLELTIKGPWLETVLFEVPLMAIISELYFKTIDTNWNMEGQKEQAREKIKRLNEKGCFFAEFGTRRRRSFETQNIVIKEFNRYIIDNSYPNAYTFINTFVGTSNLYFAKKYDLTPIGSIPHEIVMGSQVLNSINHCNYYSMENWTKVYKNVELGTMLTDTITIDAFLKDFNRKYSILFNSIRQDSGNEFLFIDKMIEHYKNYKINPQEKTIIFSNNLNVEKCIEIRKYCEGKIKCSFGIGTDLTGSFINSPPLNMVIKLWSINNFPAVKISDDQGKESGDPKAVETMKWIIRNN